MFIEACKNISSENGEESCGGRPSGRTVRFAAWLLAASVILAGCGSKNTSSGSVSGGVAQASAEALTEESAGSDAAGQNSGDGFEIILDENGGRLVEASPADATAEEGEAETETTVQETEPDYSSMITGTMYSMDFVNVRGGAGTDAEVVGHLNPEEAVDVVEKVDADWTQVVYDGRLCYIASEFLTDDPDWRAKITSSRGYKNGDAVSLDPSWRFADFSVIHSGSAVMYLASNNRKNITIGVNAGHGTKGGPDVKTYCHPDKTAKVTGGTTAAGATMAMAVSAGMNFNDGTPEKTVTLQMAQILKQLLLDNGYDVLMIRDGEDVQLDNVARTVICNNAADCHIAIHWDGDTLNYDKGCFYMSVPDGIKYMEPVASTWEEDERLGNSLIKGLEQQGVRIFGNGTMDMDLTQTSFSSVPSVDIELGNKCSDHSSDALYERGYGLLRGINIYYGFG